MKPSTKKKKRKIWTQTTRNISILAIALTIGAVAVFIQIRIVKAQTTTKQVLVAENNILPFTPISGKLVLKKVVKSTVPEDAITSLDQIEGQELVTNDLGLQAGIPVSKSMLVSAKDSKYGESVDLKQGEQFIGVQTDQVRSAGDLIKPGTIADAYVFIPGGQQSDPTLVTPDQDPLLRSLYIQDRQNQNGDVPQTENQTGIPAIAIVRTSNPAVVAALIRYQEEGRVYFAPSGIDRTQAAQIQQIAPNEQAVQTEQTVPVTPAQ